MQVMAGSRRFVAFLLAGCALALPAWGDIAIDNVRSIVYFTEPYYGVLKNLWRLDSDGRLTMIRTGGFGSRDLATDRDGNLYVHEANKLSGVVWKVTPDGKFEQVVAETGGVLNIWKLAGQREPGLSACPNDEFDALPRTKGFSSVNPTNMARAPDGSVLLADFDQRRVVRVYDNRALVVWTSTGNRGPLGAAVGVNGDLYVLEYEYRKGAEPDVANPRLIRVREGKVQVLAFARPIARVGQR